MKLLDLPLKRLTINRNCQPRVDVSESVAERYAEDMRAESVRRGHRRPVYTFPPIVVFLVLKVYLLVSGWHRRRACQIARIGTIAADVRTHAAECPRCQWLVTGEGMGAIVPCPMCSERAKLSRLATERDAILFSLHTNIKHGLHRSDDDKRRAVNVTLDDAEWSKWSSSEVARRCGVSEHLVRKIKMERSEEEVRRRNAAAFPGASSPGANPPPVTCNREGTTYTMQPRGSKLGAALTENERCRRKWLREAIQHGNELGRLLTDLRMPEDAEIVRGILEKLEGVA